MFKVKVPTCLLRAQWVANGWISWVEMKGKVGNDRYFGINSRSVCHTVPWFVHGNA